MTEAQQLEADIEEIRRDTRDPDLREALVELARTGEIVNSGRRRNGQIVWIAATQH